MSALTGQLDAVLETLRVAVNASRATLRMDDVARGWAVALPCAEALGPGVKSMRSDGSINQRAASTAQWLAAHKRNLLQPDLAQGGDPAPPAALIAAYGVHAQMLGPVLDRTGYLAGWISIHYVDGPYPLAEADSVAMDLAREEVARLLK